MEKEECVIFRLSQDINFLLDSEYNFMKLFTCGELNKYIVTDCPFCGSKDPS